MNIKRLGIILFSSVVLTILVYLLIGSLYFFNIRNVRIESKMDFLNQQEIKDVLKNDISNSFFTVNITNVQKKLKSLPFVKEAKVKRIWPNTLQIKITEIDAIARIKVENSVLYILSDNCKYLKISKDKFSKFKELPVVLVDKNGLSSYEKIRICDTFNFINTGFSNLNKNLNSNNKLTQVNINAVNSISSTVNDKVVINFGKIVDENTVKHKILRLQNYIKKNKNINDFRYIDLRYTNGIAAK